MLVGTFIFLCVSLRSDCVEEGAETGGGREERDAILDVGFYAVSALNRPSGCPWTILQGQHNLKFHSGGKLNEHCVRGTSSISARARFSVTKCNPDFSKILLHMHLLQSLSFLLNSVLWGVSGLHPSIHPSIHPLSETAYPFQGQGGAGSDPT